MDMNSKRLACTRHLINIFLLQPYEIVIIVLASVFTKLSWPGDSEGTFQFSSQATMCLPNTMEASLSPS